MWFAVAIVIAVPLAFDPGGYFIFLPLKWMLAGVLVSAGIAALILGRRPFHRSAWVYAWVGFIIVLVASSVLGIGGLTSWIGNPSRYLGVIAWLIFFGAFLLGTSLSAEKDKQRVVRAASATSIVVSVYALLQVAGIDPIQWSNELDLSRSRSTLGNAVFLGAYLVMIAPLSARLSFSKSEPARARALHAAAAILSAVALITTQTRGAWLGALAGGLVVLLLEFPRIRATPRRSIAWIGSALILVILLATVSPVASRIRSIADPTTGTARGRLTQWQLTLEAIADRPILGWGPETYAFVFPHYIDARYERTVGREVTPDRAHNVFLDLASTTGMLGVVGFIALLASLAWKTRRNRELSPLTVGVSGACAAYLVQLQFSFPLADLDTIFWLFGGLLVASNPPRTITVPRALATVPVIAALLLAIWGTSDVLADRSLRRSLNAEAKGDFLNARLFVQRAADLSPRRVQYLQAAARLHRRVGETSGQPEDFLDGIEALDRAQSLMPHDLELSLDRANLLLSWGEVVGDRLLITQAARRFEKILEEDQYSSRAHLKLGIAYVQLAREEEAEREWLTTVMLSPRSPGPLINLAILYDQQGRSDEARKAIRDALAIDPSNEFAREVLRGLKS